MLIQYIVKNGKRSGVVVATGRNKLGWSLLNHKDKWNRKLGLRIAQGRAEKKRGNTVLEFKDDILINHKYPRLRELIPILSKVRDRAEKYFKEQ